MEEGGDRSRSRLRPTARIATVDEALAFSPLTSIIPFDPTVVPFPIAYNNTAPLRLLSNERAVSANSILRSLDKEARGAEHASSRIQSTLSDIQRLIGPKERPDFKFKALVQSNGRESNGHTSSSNSAAQNALTKLSPFARRLLNTGSSASPRTDQQDGPTLDNAKRGAASEVPRQAFKTSTNGHVKGPPGQTTSPTSLLSLHQSSSLTYGPAHSQITPRSGAYVVNPILSQGELAEFEQGALPADAADLHAPTEPRVTAVPSSSPINDQRQKGQEAESRLRALVSDILEAEIEAETGDAMRNTIFTMIDTEEGGSVVLSTDAQTGVEKAVAAATKYHVTSKLPVEDLARVQKICHRSIAACGERTLAIGSDWNDEQVSDWNVKIGLAEQGLLATRTTLRIMNSGSDDRQLFSEVVVTPMLDFIRHTVESCLVTVVEMRSVKEEGTPFKVAHRSRSRLLAICNSVTKVVTLLGNLFFNIDMDETAVSAVQTLCTSLIFVENAASESDSILGIQTFEKLRRTAMDTLAKLFARNVDQRQSIFDDVLTSLERLPVGRQSARQYKLPDAKPIQLVSALLMRLVQTSAMGAGTKVQRDTLQAGASGSVDDGESDEEEDADYDSNEDTPRKARKKGQSTAHTGGHGLASIVVSAFEAAQGHAAYITNFLVKRALNSTKSSNEPYRNLLDIFVEDFLNVLGNTDWPAAELFLRQFLSRFYELTENKQSSAPSKAMALELMGAMLSGITDLRLHTSATFERPHEESPMFDRLKGIWSSTTFDDFSDTASLSLQGPYRALLEYLRLRPDSDANISTALSYHLMQWAYQIIKPTGRETSETPQPPSLNAMSVLEAIIRDPHHYEIDGNVRAVSTEEGRLGSALVTLRLPVCRLFNQVFNKLLTSMSVDQASLRSKSLRSVEDVLQKDPAILDRGSFVLGNILKCMTDKSIQVRDAALGLLSTCLQLRPLLDANAHEHILRRTTDPAAVVRKRAIRLSKEVYLRNETVAMRSRIADALVHCISDLESTVIDLARTTLEEVWIAPFHAVVGDGKGDAAARTKLSQQASLIVETVRRNPDIAETLQDLFEDVMSAKSKSSKANIAVCKGLVLVMVDMVIEDSSNQASRAATMQALAVLAQARPTLFASAQVQPLLPYLKDLASTDDLMVYRYAIIILRCTLPHIANLPITVLEDTKSALLSTVTRISGQELKEVASCLWTLTEMTGTPDRLIKITRSAMVNLKDAALQAQGNEAVSRKVERLVRLVGNFLRAFDLDKHIDEFRPSFPQSKAAHVVAIAVDLICPLTSPKQSTVVRSTALESLLLMCHAWPSQYQRQDVAKALELILKSGDQELELVLMRAWKEFFIPGTDRRPVDDKQTNGTKTAADSNRIEKTYVATDRDGASTSLAHRFINDLIRSALHSTGELGLLSAQVVTNINKVGLVHPVESASALVALETSPDPIVAKMAFDGHSELFSKHETIFDKETVRAVQQAFTYQKETIKSTQGYTDSPPVPKLHYFWDVLSTASAKVRRKFLTGICTHLDFEHGKLDMTGGTPIKVQLTGFVIQNLALVEYSKHEDLTALVEGLEKVVSSTGTTVAHDIEGALLHSSINDGQTNGNTNLQASGMQQNGGAPLTMQHEPLPNGHDTSPLPASVTKLVDPAKLRELTAGAQILTLLWDLRTFLRRLYSLSKPATGATRGRPSKDPTKAKEQIRAPQRSTNAVMLTERFLNRSNEILSASRDEDKSRELCLHLQRLMSVDDEVKVKADGDGVEDSLMDDSGFVGYGRMTPDGTESGGERAGSMTPGKRGRKRKSATPAGTPRKKKRAGSRGPGRPRKKSHSSEDDDDWE